jgi:hypothetical protein
MLQEIEIMNSRVVPLRNEGLRSCSTAPNLKPYGLPPPSPRRRLSVAELNIPKRKDSIPFFSSPQNASDWKNVSWGTPSSKPKLNMSHFLVNTLKEDLEPVDENRVPPRQPRRQNAIVRLTPTPRRKDPVSAVLPRIGIPLA